MSAQYLVNLNATGPIEIISEGERTVGELPPNTETPAKQKEALYYIVAVITFYALTFMVLICKYARFKRKELDDTVPYFPLPPDSSFSSTSKMAASRAGAESGANKAESDTMALRKYGGPSCESNYGSSDVTTTMTTIAAKTPTPKVMRVKMVPDWLCSKRELSQACDV